SGEASGRNGGGVRVQGRIPTEIPLALFSIDLWKGMERRIGRPVAYAQSGHLYIAENDADMAFLEGKREVEVAAGLTTEMIGPNKLAELVPGLGIRSPGAKFCAMSGAAEPALATTAIARTFERRGGLILTHETVRAVHVANRAVTGVETDR